jgi:hypothetical protein
MTATDVTRNDRKDTTLSRLLFPLVLMEVDGDKAKGVIVLFEAILLGTIQELKRNERDDT